jgi:hypothetical protein
LKLNYKGVSVKLVDKKASLLPLCVISEGIYFLDNFLAAAALSASAYKSPTISVIDHGAIALLKDALPLPANKGGAIKEKIRA